MINNQLFPFQGITPQVDPSSFIATGAKLIGQVTVKGCSGIWYNAVLRADFNRLIIGEYTSIQDNCTVHVGPEPNNHPDTVTCAAIIGNYVTVGHNSILHSCVVEDHCLVGMGAILLDGCRIGRGSVVAAGAVVTKDTVIPPFSVVAGTPAKVMKTLDESSLSDRISQAMGYWEMARKHKQSLGL